MGEILSLLVRLLNIFRKKIISVIVYQRQKVGWRIFEIKWYERNELKALDLVIVTKLAQKPAFFTAGKIMTLSLKTFRAVSFYKKSIE